MNQKLRTIFFIQLVFGVFPLVAAHSVFAQATTICVRKKVNLKKKKLPFQNLFQTTDGTCPSKYVPIFQEQDAADIAAEFLIHDGIGSNLDADFLDGMTSSDFATSSTVQDVIEAVQEANGNITTLHSHLTNLQDEVNALDTRTAPKNVLTVAKQGGDFQSLEDALATLNNPSEQNPFLIHIGPGTFPLSSAIEIPSGTVVQGSGENATILTSSLSLPSLLAGGLIHLNSGSEISDLTVMHTPGSDFGVTLVVEGGSQSDLEDPTTFHTTVRDCNIITDGSTASDSQGVLINGSSVQILSSNISVRSGGSSSHGINFIGGINSRLRLLDSTIYAEGTPQGIGIDVLALGVKATLKGVDIYGSTVSINDALGLIAEIKNSTLRSIANGIVSTGPTSQIRLFYTAFEAADHVLFLPPADVTCAFASNVTTGQSYTSTCE